MRQLAVTILVAIFLITLAGCGGHSTSSSAPSAVSVSPSSLSLNLGDVSGLSAAVVDSNGATVTVSTKTTFTSSNAAVATVSTSGSVCAGTWDAQNIYCTPGQVGTATITVTNGALSSTVTVFTHAKVDRVTLSPASVNCVSMGGTQQMTAKAFSNGVDVTSSVGLFNWASSDSHVVTLDSNGLASAAGPGQASVYANINGVSSVPAPFGTCGVQSIHLHLANAADTSFTFATAATQQLAADVVDTAGKAISPALTWNTTQGLVASVSSAGLVTALVPGTASIYAECANPCNLNQARIYSDVVVANVSGTSATTTAYATGTGTTSLVPIDTGTNAAGTTVTLPSTPNSFVFVSNGARAFLGSSGGLMVLDPATNAVTQTVSAPGRVLAASPDGLRALVADSNVVHSVGVVNASSEDLNIAGATAAAFAPDGSRAYIAAGNTLYVFFPDSGTAPATFGLTAPVNDFTFLASDAFAYLAGGTPSSITGRAVCDASLADTKATPATPKFLASTPDGVTILGVDSPGLDIVTRTTPAQPGCPPPLSSVLSEVDFQQGAFTPRQLILLPNGSKGYVTSNLGQLLVYDLTAASASTIPLANNASPTTGGATLNSAMLYVGGSDNNVHRIDVAGGKDAQQISVPFTPDLVAVRPK